MSIQYLVHYGYNIGRSDSLECLLICTTGTVSSIDGLPTQDESATESGIDSAVLIVMAICSVAIVALITGTAILILRKRKPKGNHSYV